MNEESRAAFLMAILDVAPSTRLQYARMLRSMLEINSTPLGMAILGSRRIAARSETKQARPLTKEERDQVIRSRADWKQRCFLTCVDNKPLARDCGLDSQQCHAGAGRDRNF
ncbi:hypothetical protein TcBrA4_0123190 [Trypanosoma cruzi]|nr:hypothetical protein TcBrA4_0123190 [Trypanosoma cruzi]